MNKILLSIAILSVSVSLAASDNKIDLAGTWQFGYGDKPVYNDKITLPGSMLTNGKGNDVDTETKWTGSLYDMSYYYSDLYKPYREPGNIKFPFFLTPDKEYVGNAYYKKEVKIPADWKDQRVILHLERPHIETILKVNGEDVGHQMSLSTPHEYDITKYVNPGKTNKIELTVYNGIENVCVGQDSHSVTDQTQGNWNGIAGDIYLKASPKDAYIKNVRVYPDVKNKRAEIKVIKGGNAKKIKKVNAKVVSDDGADIFNLRNWELSGDTLTFTVDFGDKMKTWDEFSTPLYDVTVNLGDDTATTSFGMRDISVSGRDILINGRPMYVRGTVVNSCLPHYRFGPTREGGG